MVHEAQLSREIGDIASPNVGGSVSRSTRNPCAASKARMTLGLDGERAGR
jgi:hypothetical protein